jgi:putative tryptophan/tyrosine transport system substrate-binding protein
MRRREFVAGLFATAIAAAAEAETPPRISILHSGFPNRTPIHLLLQALAALGYENGRTAAIDLHGAEGDPDRLRAIVGTLVAQRPNVIIAITSPAVLALKQAGLTSPVAFAFVSDPVGLGVVESLAHPGRNFTGVTYTQATLGGKWLDLLLEALPTTQRIGVLWSRTFQENPAIFDSIRTSAILRGIDVLSRELLNVEDLEPAFQDAATAGAQAIIFITDNLMFGHRERVASLAIAHHLPSIHSFPPEVRDGGMMSYGPSLGENYKRAAVFADRILKGALPGELPVEQPTTFELVVNLKTVKALGLIIPESLLLRADEVIE